MRWFLALIALLTFAGESAAQSKGKGIRLWNLTTETISSFQLSPSGKTEWGPNQTLNDKDKEVDHDERLRITDIAPGRYDVRFTDKIGRVCVVKDIEVKDGAIFSIEEKELSDCSGAKL
jgi:hypothetical protein